MKYCTYILLDPRKPTEHIFENTVLNFQPFYVGKGLKRRPKEHIEKPELSKKTLKSSIVKSILSKGLTPIVHIYKDSITESEAITLEKVLIKFFGRIDVNTGILANHTDGGEGHAGYKQSKELIEKRIAHRRGIKRDPLIYEKMKETRRKNGSYTMKEETKEKLRLVRHSDVTKQKIREKRKLQVFSEEVIKKRTQKLKKPVLQYDLKGNLIKKWDSIKEAARFLNIHDSGIIAVLKGTQKTCKNHKWEYYINKN